MTDNPKYSASDDYFFVSNGPDHQTLKKEMEKFNILESPDKQFIVWQRSGDSTDRRGLHIEKWVDSSPSVDHESEEVKKTKAIEMIAQTKLDTEWVQDFLQPPAAMNMPRQLETD